MPPLSIRLTPGARLYQTGLEADRHMVARYETYEDIARALEDILRSLEEFAAAPENREMVCKALDYCAPELSILAGHVAVIHRLESAVADRDLDAREMRAAQDLRSQTANIWAHGRAGQILIDSQKPFAA